MDLARYGHDIIIHLFAFLQMVLVARLVSECRLTSVVCMHTLPDYPFPAIIFLLPYC